MSGVSAERDARPEHQSSSPNSLRNAPQGLARFSSPLLLSFAAFVLLHFSGQAYRAATDGALPEAGFERSPWLVTGVSFLLWLPFSVFGVRQLSRWSSPSRLKQLSGQARALGVIEPLSLAIVLLFGWVHWARLSWPLISGALDGIDVRAELVRDLSSAWHGLPIQGIAYLCAVGAAAFCAARLTLALLPAGRSGLSRAVVSLAVLAYLLGSYAVIRCGSGSLLP